MNHANITSLLVTSELRADRVGPRGVYVGRVRSFFGGLRATREYSSSTHTYSLPVVREMPPHQVRSAPTW
jgi:hypothetical protein